MAKREGIIASRRGQWEQLLAATLVTLNLVVDLTYAWLDPRIRYS